MFLKKNTITNATTALPELAEKGADIDVMLQMVQFMTQRLMELDVEGRCGTTFDEKHPAERLKRRDGYREPAWDARAGSIKLKIPQAAPGSHLPELLERRSTTEKVLTAVILAAYVQSISTRSMDDLVKSLGMSGASISHVRRRHSAASTNSTSGNTIVSRSCGIGW